MVFVVLAYAIFKLLKRLRIKVDEELALLIAPWIGFGGVLRVLQDAGVVSSYLFVTPGIWFLVSSLVLGFVFLSKWLEGRLRIPYFKLPFLAGLVALSASIPFLRPTNPMGPLLVLAFFSPWAFAFWLVKWGLANRIVALIHLFDATTTFVALQFFGYGEQHVLPGLFIAALGPVSFIPLKLVAIICFLLLVDRCEDSELRNYLKLVAAILGGGPAVRDFVEVLTLAQLS
jgi:uncharacterized membrane protein